MCKNLYKNVDLIGQVFTFKVYGEEKKLNRECNWHELVYIAKM